MKNKKNYQTAIVLLSLIGIPIFAHADEYEWGEGRNGMTYCYSKNAAGGFPVAEEYCRAEQSSIMISTASNHEAISNLFSNSATLTEADFKNLDGRYACETIEPSGSTNENRLVIRESSQNRKQVVIEGSRIQNFDLTFANNAINGKTSLPYGDKNFSLDVYIKKTPDQTVLQFDPGFFDHKIYMSCNKKGAAASVVDYDKKNSMSLAAIGSGASIEFNQPKEIDPQTDTLILSEYNSVGCALKGITPATERRLVSKLIVNSYDKNTNMLSVRTLSGLSFNLWCDQNGYRSVIAYEDANDFIVHFATPKTIDLDTGSVSEAK